MSGQLDLFEVQARARQSDPSTSHEAAAKVNGSGETARQAEEVLAEVRRRPWSTSAELAAAMGLERHIPARRLPDLRRAGLVVNGPKRVCLETGNKSLTWGPPCIA